MCARMCVGIHEGTGISCLLYTPPGFQTYRHVSLLSGFHLGTEILIQVLMLGQQVLHLPEPSAQLKPGFSITLVTHTENAGQEKQDQGGSRE